MSKKMSSKVLAKKQLLAYWQHLPLMAQQEALDFMGYLFVRSETDEQATEEILRDPSMMLGIKRGLAQIKRGEVSRVEF